MKKILLKAFMLLCLILWGGVSSAWAVTVPATMAAGNNGTAAKVNDKDAIKVGTSKAGGDMTITVPANSTSLTFYAAAWNGVSNSSLNITPAASVQTTTIFLTADSGISGNSPFTLSGSEATYKFTINLNNITVETTLTLAGSSRFVVWGATVEVVNTQTYTVTFDAGVNGACSTSSLEESAAGAGVTLPNVTANTGFNFIGWSTDATPTSANAGKAGDTYNPVEDCTLYAYYKVARPANEVFYESFDTNEGKGGNDDSWSGSIASSNFKSDNTWIVKNASGASHCAKFGTGSALGSATTPAIAESGNFTLTFKAAAWNGNSESTTLKLSATGATLSVSSVTLTKGAWNTYNVNITNAKEGFTITFEGNKESNSRFFLDEVSVVVASAPTSTDITISSVGYATFFDSEHAYVMPDDCEGYVFTAANGLELAYDAEDVVPAGEPLVLYTIEPGTKTLVFTTSSDETYKSGDMNDLDGTDAETVLAADDNFYFYGLSLNASNELSSVGFYWMNETGAAFTNGAHKAYLKLSKSMFAEARSGFAFNEDTEALESIEMSAATTIYTLNGVKVNELQKGLNIVNGKKVMVK